MTNIILLSASDRFNYGDLLFPIISKNEINDRNPKLKIDNYSLSKSDLSRFGALKTLGIRSLFEGAVLSAGDLLIYAGGGTIGTDFSYMLSNQLSPNSARAFDYIKRVLGDENANKISKKYFGANLSYPWIACPDDFPAQIKIAYNAIGGSEFANLVPHKQFSILNILEKSSFLSVRDIETKRLFSPLESKIAVKLAPDSAVLMSEQFPVSRLRVLSKPSLLSIIDANPYICFQASYSYIKKHSDDIISVLEDAYNSFGLPTVLLPIGRCVDHEDQIGLRDIFSKISTPATLVSDEASIWEIMLVIAQAKLFLGTSLHGNVTAQSFAVPHLGLSARCSKLDYYLETWDLPGQSKCIELRAARQHIEAVLKISIELLQNKRAELIMLSHDNYSALADACELEWGDSK